MPQFSNRLTAINDPGHGWLRVPLVEIALLGIEEQITPYSFIEGNYAYLEEDCDCPRFLDALTAQNLPRPEITDEYVDRFERPSLRFQDPALTQAFWDRLRR
jgi:hypothetical protein